MKVIQVIHGSSHILFRVLQGGACLGGSGPDGCKHTRYFGVGDDLESHVSTGTRMFHGRI